MLEGRGALQHNNIIAYQNGVTLMSYNSAMV